MAVCFVIVKVIIDYLPHLSNQFLVSVFSASHSVPLSLLIFSHFHSSSEYLLFSRLCLCLSAGVNVHRHAHCLRLSVTLLPSLCEPAFCCCISFGMHSVAGCLFHFHFCIIFLVGSSIICLKHTFNALLLQNRPSAWCRRMCSAVQSAALNVNSGVNR